MGRVNRVDIATYIVNEVKKHYASEENGAIPEMIEVYDRAVDKVKRDNRLGEGEPDFNGCPRPISDAEVALEILWFDENEPFLIQWKRQMIAAKYGV